MRMFAPLLLLAGAVGCSAPNPTATQIPLTEAARVTVMGVYPESRMNVMASNGATQASALDLRVQAVTLELTTADSPRIHQLVMPLADFDVAPSAMPPDGLKLRDMSLAIARPVHATIKHAEADALELTAQVPLTLSWWLLLDDGEKYRLGSVQTAPVNLDVTVFRNAGATEATVDARCTGECWSATGLIDLRDGHVFVEAQADVQPAR
jgi:hypothetical protein